MLSAIWSMCQVLFASRLQNTAEIFEVYGMRLFGSVQITGKNQVLMRFFEDKNRNRKQMTEDEQLSLIASNIELVCKMMICIRSTLPEVSGRN